jgi:hypothetical protein
MSSGQAEQLCTLSVDMYNLNKLNFSWDHLFEFTQIEMCLETQFENPGTIFRALITTFMAKIVFSFQKFELI